VLVHFRCSSGPFADQPFQVFLCAGGQLSQQDFNQLVQGEYLLSFNVDPEGFAHPLVYRDTSEDAEIKQRILDLVSTHCLRL